MGKGIDSYRDMLVDMEQKTMASYDKTLISLSTGALGLSIVFLKDIFTETPTFICLLVISWIMWGLSLCLILISFYFSSLSFRYAIKQVDKNVINNETPGGVYSIFCNILTPISGFFFMLGILFFIIFTVKNIGG